MSELERIVQYAKSTNCSDIHLTEGAFPAFRRHGVLQMHEWNEITTSELILSMTDEDMRRRLAANGDIDFSLSLLSGRQRVNIFWQSSQLAAAMRLLSDRIPTIDELFLPPVLKKLTHEPWGLVLVTGPTGSGKSTTLAAMIDAVRKSRQCHIVTIEDPIEYVYPEGISLIHQRELGADVPTFGGALKSVLREDPDVILVGEMRDLDTISAALTAAETGHLVFSTLHTTGAAHTLDRIVDVFPPYGQGQVRAQLANVLRGVVTQRLLPLADGTGRIVATEVMIANDAVANLIREGKSHQLPTMIQAGANYGMHTLDSCLVSLVKEGKITAEVALKNTLSPADFKRLLYSY